MSRSQIDHLLEAFRLLIQPVSDAVKANDKKIDEVGGAVAELRGELAGLKRYGRWPWILAILACLVALAAMGQDVSKILEAIF